MKKYRVHFAQINRHMVEVEASTPKAAYNKARRQVRDDYRPYLEVVEHDIDRLKETRCYWPDELGVDP